MSLASAPPDEVVTYGPLADHVADIRHGTDAARRPLVVFVHGGFWRPAYDRTHTGPLAAALAEAGWSVASIEYRRTPGTPDETTDDVLRAVDTLGPLIGGHRGDVVVAGHSAGGHLALWLAAAGRGPITGVVALGPVADLGLAESLGLGDGAVEAFLGGPAATRPDLDPARCPVPAIATTIVHGELDSIVPLSIPQRYAEVHPSTRLVVVDGAAHFEVIDPRSAAWPVVVAEMARASGDPALR